MARWCIGGALDAHAGGRVCRRKLHPNRCRDPRQICPRLFVVVTIYHPEGDMDSLFLALAGLRGTALGLAHPSYDIQIMPDGELPSFL